MQTYRKPESEPNPNPETNPRSIILSHGERPNPELCRKVLTSSWDGTSRLWQRPERQSWEDQDMIHWRLVLPALKGSRPLKAPSAPCDTLVFLMGGFHPILLPKNILACAAFGDMRQARPDDAPLPLLPDTRLPQGTAMGCGSMILSRSPWYRKMPRPGKIRASCQRSPQRWWRRAKGTRRRSAG